MKVVRKQNVGAMVNNHKKDFELLDTEIAILKLLVCHSAIFKLFIM